MRQLVLRGMGQRRLRTLLSALAVMLGVAMIAGTYVQTDQISAAFEEIEQTTNAGSDVIVRPREAFQGSFSVMDPLDEAVVERIAAVPGVASAQGGIWDAATLVIDGKRVGNDFAPSFASSIMDEPFDPTEMVDGRDPVAPGEIAIDEGTADRERLAVGDQVAVAVRTGTKPVEIVGVYDYGGVSFGGAIGIVTTLPVAQEWFDRPGQVSSVAAAAEPGVAATELARRVQDVLPTELEALTGEADATRNAAEINDALGSFLTPALLALAGAAVLVGAFIIFNTFSITVAQRTREFALLRSLGATRRQLMAAVAGEAALIGASASALGLLAGLGFSRALGALFDAVGFGIPRADMQLAPRTIAISAAVGIGVTLAAALIPALRATRVSPVLAMASAAAPARRSPRWAPWVAGLMAAGGLALLVAGLFGGGAATSRMGSMAGGVVLLFVGVALSARHLVRPLARVVGWPIERLFHTMGTLARENTVREPGRTATTSAALMVGIGLVVFVAVFANGLKASISGGFEDRIQADYVIAADSLSAADPQTTAAADIAASVDGVRSAGAQRFQQVQIDGKPVKATTDVVNGLDVGTLADWYSFEWIDGEDALLARLQDRPAAVIEEQFSKAHGIAVGDDFTVTSPAGRRVRLTAIGSYKDPMILQGVIVADTTFERIAPAIDPWAVWVSADPGADPGPVLTAALDPFPGLKVQTEAAYEDAMTARMDQMVYLLYALLAMSVVISLFGIANSLFLSIHERTREFGLLRAVGTTREQVRQMVRYESVITAVIGGLLGIVLGLVFAALMTAALADLGLVFSVPAGQLVAFLVLAVLVGIAGAVIPARRGARLDILRALHQE